jgi:carbonic anhydrase
MVQARRVCRTTIVQQAWQRGRQLTVHAWVYSLNDGLLRDLGFTASTQAEASARYKSAVAALS